MLSLTSEAGGGGAAADCCEEADDRASEIEAVNEPSMLPRLAKAFSSLGDCTLR